MIEINLKIEDHNDAFVENYAGEMERILKTAMDKTVDFLVKSRAVNKTLVVQDINGNTVLRGTVNLTGET